MHGWQSESAHGPKGGCDFWSNSSGYLTRNCRTQSGVAKCNEIVLVAVVVVEVVML